MHNPYTNPQTSTTYTFAPGIRIEPRHIGLGHVATRVEALGEQVGGTVGGSAHEEATMGELREDLQRGFDYGHCLAGA